MYYHDGYDGVSGDFTDQSASGYQDTAASNYTDAAFGACGDQAATKFGAATEVPRYAAGACASHWLPWGKGCKLAIFR